MSGYQVSPHCYLRIDERNLSPSDIAQALAGERWQDDKKVYFYNRQTRLMLVACPRNQVIITAYRLSRKGAREVVSYHHRGTQDRLRDLREASYAN